MHIRGTKPTREERKIIENAGLDTYEWLVQKHTSKIMVLIHRTSGKIKEIEITL